METSKLIPLLGDDDEAEFDRFEEEDETIVQLRQKKIKLE